MTTPTHFLVTGVSVSTFVPLAFKEFHKWFVGSFFVFFILLFHILLFIYFFSFCIYLISLNMMFLGPFVLWQMQDLHFYRSPCVCLYTDKCLHVPRLTMEQSQWGLGRLPRDARCWGGTAQLVQAGEKECIHSSVFIYEDIFLSGQTAVSQDPRKIFSLERILEFRSWTSLMGSGLVGRNEIPEAMKSLSNQAEWNRTKRGMP